MKKTSMLISMFALAACGQNQGQGSVVESHAASSACIAHNYLDRDSFDVAGSGFKDCLAGKLSVACKIAVSSMEVRGLDEGVGTIRATLKTASDGTSQITVYGTPTEGDGPANVILSASGIPAGVALGDALMALYFGSDTVPAAPLQACSWK